jgi:predicted outer membrane repeat protein
MMKQIMACISSLLLLSTFSTAWALGLSLNQTHFLPGDTLILTLDENWSGEADVYMAVTLPDDTLFFLSPPQNFGLDFVPYAVSKPASGSVELLRMDLPVLPVGEYTFYSAAMRAGSPFDIDMVLDITSISFIFATEGIKPVDFSGILSFGEHGTFKECNGLQMAFNSVQDLNEIRIEQGTYECHGLEIPSSKSFEHGIKISGGWDSRFESQSNDPALTVFDGKEEGWILLVRSAGPMAIEGLSFQNGNGAIYGGEVEVSITNCIFTNNSVSAVVSAVYQVGNITNSTFTNNTGGAVYDSGDITNSTFTNNSASSYHASGGAVYDSGDITNSTFTNNSASKYGGAVYDSGNITNSIFTNNSTSDNGGAVYGSGNITNSIFTNNSASDNGGAVSNSGNIINSTFNNNSARDGGAVSNSHNITNSTFTNNSASGDGGAVYDSSNITNSTFTNNSAYGYYGGDGGAVYYSSGNITFITNSIFTNNSAKNGDGGAVVRSLIINSIFTNNSAKQGGAVYYCSIFNSTLVNNSASDSGGAFAGNGTILNSIFAQNKVGEEANDIASGGSLKIGHTLVNGVAGGVNLGTGDPRFVDADNGDFHLRPDSPAINVGYSNVNLMKFFLKDEAGQEIDLDGNPRIVGGAIDLGAYESQ